MTFYQKKQLARASRATRLLAKATYAGEALKFARRNSVGVFSLNGNEATELASITRVPLGGRLNPESRYVFRLGARGTLIPYLV